MKCKNNIEEGLKKMDNDIYDDFLKKQILDNKKCDVVSWDESKNQY